MKRTEIIRIAGLCLAAALVPAIAQADATIESVTHFGGVMGMAASDIHSVTEIQGMKQRTESTVKFKGAILGALQSFAGHKGGSKNIEIYRLDKDVQWTLNPEHKTYSEVPVYVPPSKADAAGSGTTDDEASGQKDHTKVVKNEVKVNDTGKTQTINGFNTHEYIITWYVEAVDEDTGKHSKSLMTSDIWASTDHGLAQVHAEQTKFNQALMEKKHEMLDSMLGKRYGFGAVSILGAASSEALGKALEKVKGLPVRTTVTWEASGQPEQGGDGGEQAAEQAKAAAALQQLGSLFGSHSDAKKPEKDAAHPDMTKIFDSTTEVQKVSAAALPASTFDIPAGYRKD